MRVIILDINIWRLNDLDIQMHIVISDKQIKRIIDNVQKRIDAFSGKPVIWR